MKHLLCLYPWLTIGGSDKFNLDMLGQLRPRMPRITIATTLPSSHPWREQFAPLSDAMIDLTAFPPEQYPARLLQLIASSGADTLLVSHSTLGYHLLPYLRAHLPELVCVDYCHIATDDWRDGGYPRLSIDYRAQLDLQVVSSQQLRGWMCARGADGAQIEVCTTNIDSAEWDPARYDRAALRHGLGLDHHSPVVLFAARLEAEKQPRLAAAIMREVARAVPEARFLVAGDGRYAHYMRGYLRSFGLEQRVRMLGAVSNARIRELLALSDLFFLPSQNEGIALALYEAMAMGVAPVAANVGGQAELVATDCGILVQRGPGERAAYVAALTTLLRDPARMRALGMAARQRVVQHFRLDQMGTRMEQLLHAAHLAHVAHPRPPPPAAQALAAARRAVAVARVDQAELRLAAGKAAGARALYWRLVEGGPWWLLPALERARRLSGALRIQA